MAGWKRKGQGGPVTTKGKGGWEGWRDRRELGIRGRGEGEGRGGEATHSRVTPRAEMLYRGVK